MFDTSIIEGEEDVINEGRCWGFTDSITYVTMWIAHEYA